MSGMAVFGAAEGITLGGTRLIYPEDVRQVSISVKNTAGDSSFLVQSWIEDNHGKKSDDFIVTPPLYVSGPGHENTLRIIYTGAESNENIEKLYYFNAKSIPSVDKNKVKTESLLLIATVTRIKLFFRPSSLSDHSEIKPSSLTFRQSGNRMLISNPTPFHITVSRMKAGEKPVAGIMVPPLSDSLVGLPEGHGKEISFSTINDFGATVPEDNAMMK